MGGGNGGSNRSMPSPSDPALGDIFRSGLDWLVAQIRPSEEATVENPTWNSYESPRHTVETFLEAMEHIRMGREEAWPRALEAFGSNAGEELKPQAKALFAVFQRLGKVSATSLPGTATVDSDSINRYEVFPYGVEHEWIWTALEKPPTQHIVVVRDGQGRWSFSEETAANAEALYESMKYLPPQYQREAGKAFAGTVETLKRTPIKAWVFLIGSVAVGVFVAMVVIWALKKAGKGMENRDHIYSAGFLNSMATPLGLVIFIASLTFGSGFVELPPALDAFRWWILRFLVIVAVTVFIFKLVDLIALGLRRVAGSHGTAYDQTAILLLRRTLRTVAFVMLFIFFLQNVIGLNVTALLTGVGILGVALSLAGQGIFKNALGAFNIFINRPFLVGDWIQFDGNLGEVEDVGLYSTKVRLLSGELMTVPNMRFIDEEVQNLDERKFLRRALDIAIPYDTPKEKVEKALGILEEVLTSSEVVDEGHCDLEEQPPKISFSHYGAYFLNLRAYYWYFIEDGEKIQRQSERGWYTYLQHCTLVNLKIKEAFNEAGIEFAFPTETHYLADDPERSLEVSLENRAHQRNGKSREEKAVREENSEKRPELQEHRD